MSELQDFFQTQTQKSKKKKKKTAAGGAAMPVKAEVESKTEPESNIHETNVDDFEEDEEQKTEDLMSTATNIKDMTEVKQAKKKEQETNRDWASDLRSQPEAITAKDPVSSAPKAKKTFDASAAFGGGGRPTFSKKSGAGLNSVGGNKDFPAMGDFPTLGAETKEPSKKESSSRPTFSNSNANKSDRADIGNFGAGAALSRSDEPASGGISFGKAPPKFSRKTDKKAQSEAVAVDFGNQNYDFSKMNVASATVRKTEGEDGEEEEQKDSAGQNIEGTRKVRDKGQAFDMNEDLTKFSKQTEEDDDFTVVTNVKSAPSEFLRNSVFAKPIDMTKAQKNVNKFSAVEQEWGRK